MSYKELQAALKAFRTNGYVLQCKLNAKKAALQAEYDRIAAIEAELDESFPHLASEKPIEEVSAPQNDDTDCVTECVTECVDAPIATEIDQPEHSEPAKLDTATVSEITVTETVSSVADSTELDQSDHTVRTFAVQPERCNAVTERLDAVYDLSIGMPQSKRSIGAVKRIRSLTQRSRNKRARTILNEIRFLYRAA